MLLDILRQRGGVPSLNEAQRIHQGADMPPLRGFTPWNSGFEGPQKQMLRELMRALQMREPRQQDLQRLLPLLRGRG